MLAPGNLQLSALKRSRQLEMPHQLQSILVEGSMALQGSLADDYAVLRVASAAGHVSGSRRAHAS